MDADTLVRNISPTAWRGYNSSETDTAIIADFTARYGYAPSEIIRGDDYATVLVGPVIQENTDEDTRQA